MLGLDEKNGDISQCRRFEVENPDVKPNPSGRDPDLGGVRN
jgi:hypothetical protein